MKLACIAALVLGASMSAIAQRAPPTVNARFHTDAVGAGLSAAVRRFQRASGPLWLGYEVAAAPQPRSVCRGYAQSSMGDECCGVYRLEGPDTASPSSGDQAAQTNVAVLIRLDQGMIDKLLVVDARCQLDAGGLPFTWLAGVSEDDSLMWLSSLVKKDSGRLANPALAAIAMHETQKATTSLSGFASPSQPVSLREKAAFWLGAARGHDGLLALEKLMSDGDPGFRKSLVFDVSVNHGATAVDDLIRMARSDPDTGVREQALFWLAQKAGAKAIATLKDVAANDPEVAVKRKAVFALSRLPNDQAVPLLLHVAQTNPDRAVRKEAIFWLGQTHDPRALAYFEKILEH